MKFWKFEAPSAEQLDSVIARGELPLPQAVSGLKNTYEEIARKLKPGDGVVLGTLRGDEGKIVAFGRVRGVCSVPTEISVQWAKASHGVHPTDSGLKHWQTKIAFQISAEPAERYGLRRFIEFHVKDAA